MTQAPERFFLDLTHALTSQGEILSNLLQCQRTVTVQPEIEFDDLRFP